MSKNNFPARGQVERIRRMYPVGTKVAIVSMADPYVNMPAGTTGVVTGVDDTGTVFADWSNGSGLGAVYCEDVIRKLTRAEVVKEQVRAVAKTGRTNMFDVKAVLAIAVELGCNELCDLISMDTGRYSNLILTGELDDVE